MTSGTSFTGERICSDLGVLSFGDESGVGVFMRESSGEEEEIDFVALLVR